MLVLVVTPSKDGGIGLVGTAMPQCLYVSLLVLWSIRYQGREWNGRDVPCLRWSRTERSKLALPSNHSLPSMTRSKRQ